MNFQLSYPIINASLKRIENINRIDNNFYSGYVTYSRGRARNFLDFDFQLAIIASSV